MAQTYNFSRISLLVVDPSRYMRSLLVGLARGYGFGTVYEAKDGAAALALMQERHVDIALIDGPMEPVDGHAIIRHIRTSPDSTSPFLPIVMVSAHTAMSEVKKARDSGVTEFLAKPISSKTLLQRLCAIVDGQRPFVRSLGYTGPDRRRRHDPAFVGPEQRGVARVTPQAATAAVLATPLPAVFVEPSVT